MRREPTDKQIPSAATLTGGDRENIMVQETHTAVLRTSEGGLGRAQGNQGNHISAAIYFQHLMKLEGI